MELTQRIPQYGVNTLKDTPLWNIIQEQINNTKLEWKDGGILDGRLDSNTRVSNICWITNKLLETMIWDVVSSYNFSNWNFNIEDMESCQYGVYSKGGYYDWHFDSDDTLKKLIRKISITIFLNDPDEYGGGELDIETRGPKEKMRYDTFKLHKGSIVIFPSNKWHRVRPVTSGVRKSLVTWFSGPPFR